LTGSTNESVEADEVDKSMFADYKGVTTDAENNKQRVSNLFIKIYLKYILATK
jgi:hypothetical protein